MTDLAEKLAEHLYGHSREKAIEWAKEDKFDSCYRQSEEIIELLGVERLRAENATLRQALKNHAEEAAKMVNAEPVAYILHQYGRSRLIWPTETYIKQDGQTLTPLIAAAPKPE